MKIKQRFILRLIQSLKDIGLVIGTILGYIIILIGIIMAILILRTYFGF